MKNEMMLNLLYQYIYTAFFVLQFDLFDVIVGSLVIIVGVVIAVCAFRLFQHSTFANVV
jgi:hypothetical protein